MAGCFLTLIFLLTITIISATNGTLDGLEKHQSEPRPVWCVIVDFALIGNVYKNETSANQVVCKKSCQTDPKCVSVNFQLKGGQCEFSRANHVNSSGGLSERNGWIYTYNSQQEQRCAGAGSDKVHNCKREGRLFWPSGVYGLPMPKSGCPTKSGVIWETGFRHQDTENSGSNNYWYPSPGIHLLGPYGKNNVTQNFCIKTRDHMNEAGGDWPQGKYCLFKYGQHCPKMVSSGFIYWDDEDTNNENKVQGTVPSGVYDQDTRIDYCCMTGGNVSQPISVPTQDPFYLFPYNSQQCQVVKGMRATEEHFHCDEQDEPTNNNLEKVGGSHPFQTHVSSLHGADNIIVYYCYYEAIDSFLES